MARKNVGEGGRVVGEVQKGCKDSLFHGSYGVIAVGGVVAGGGGDRRRRFAVLANS